MNCMCKGSDFSESYKCVLVIFDTYLQITFWKTQQTLLFYYIWLRDHCRCEKCYNWKTNQKAIDILTIPLDVKPSSSEVKNENLNLIWLDGHQTQFSLKWLTKIKSHQSERQITLWDKPSVNKCTDLTVPCKDYLTEDGLKKLLQSLLTYGIGFVSRVEPSIEATECVAKRVGLVQKTLFGEMWTVSNDYLYADTAYTNIGLKVHTDNTYFNEPAGLQIFHLLSHNGNGGETLLVDGFNAAHSLKASNFEYFETLTNTQIECQYIQDGYHYSTIEPVISLHPSTRKLHQIRYNIYDRAILNTLDDGQILKFYSAYKKFGEMLNKPENIYTIKLTPGLVVFIDNWRVLHGRNAYTGLRELCGCYTPRSDWLSKAKSLKLDIM